MILKPDFRMQYDKQKQIEKQGLLVYLFPKQQ